MRVRINIFFLRVVIKSADWRGKVGFFFSNAIKIVENFLKKYSPKILTSTL